MKRVLRTPSVSLLVTTLVLLPILAWTLTSSAQKGGGSKPAGNLDQVRNGSFSNPIDPPDWVNGNAGASNAHYREGQSIPYRLVLTGLSNGQHTVVIEWDTKHSDTHAIDYITYYDRLPDSTVNPLRGLNASLFTTPPDDANIPAPNALNVSNSDVAGQPETSFGLVPAAERKMTIYNGTLEDAGMTYVFQQDLHLAQASSRMSITFTASSPNVLILWGGHIGRGDQWDGNSANQISGSPYHTRLIELDGSGGNQDRSLSAAAVLPLASCGITGPGTVCGGTSNAYQGPVFCSVNPADPSCVDSSIWSISGSGGAFDLGGGTTSVANQTSQNVTVIASGSGSYTLTLTTMKGGNENNSCTQTVTVNPVPTVAISSNISCPGLPSLSVNLNGNADTDPANYTISWTGPNNFTSSAATINPTTPGVYNVTVSKGGCTSAQASGTLCYIFQ